MTLCRENGAKRGDDTVNFVGKSDCRVVADRSGQAHFLERDAGIGQLRGIEIYKGKPIFYSLGNFAMMNNSLDDLPADMYDQFGITPGSVTAPELLQARGAKEFGDPNLYETVIAVSHYKDGRLSEIRLYPVDLGVNATGAGKGVPHLADATVGARILERLQRLSAPFGTKIETVKGVGVIRVAASPP